MTQDLLLKFKFFQDIRMWPKNSDFDYEGWLDNFSQDEQKIAQKILDFFVYFPDDIIDQMFSTVVGRAGYFFKKFDSTWCNESFSNNCWYSFIPGGWDGVGRGIGTCPNLENQHFTQLFPYCCMMVA